jgi:hypothetical protein
MTIADTNTPQPRASLLYNLGLVECGGYVTPDSKGHCGARPTNVDNARSFFKRSIALRDNEEVQAALGSLDPN